VQGGGASAVADHSALYGVRPTSPLLTQPAGGCGTMLGTKLAKGDGIEVGRLPAEQSTGSYSPINNYDFWGGLLLSLGMEAGRGIYKDMMT
jgi:hypothetical protein